MLIFRTYRDEFIVDMYMARLQSLKAIKVILVLFTGILVSIENKLVVFILTDISMYRTMEY